MCVYSMLRSEGIPDSVAFLQKHHQIILIKEHQKHEEALRQQNYKIDDILILLREGKQTDLVEAARNHPEVVRRAVGDVQAVRFQSTSSTARTCI
jgi:hypothetical protein